MNNFQVVANQFGDTLLWSEVDWIDDDGVSSEFYQKCRAIVNRFLANIENDIESFLEDEKWEQLATAAAARLQVEKDPGQAGHDLWLTSQHHGTGFWDRGNGAVGDYLTTVAQNLGVEFDGAEPS